MSEFNQPWVTHTINSERLKLQILDPLATFELEPELIKHVGGELLMGLAAPGAMMDAVASLAEDDDRPQLEFATVALRGLATIISAFPDDGVWLADVFERAILRRCRHPIHGTIETWDDWKLMGMAPTGRWRVLATQIANTFGPLWRRSPYKPSSRKAPDYGVPLPNAPLAFQWAAAIAAQGYASSAHEILSTWTPERLIDAVEVAAHAAEVANRASDAARQGAR